MKNETVMTSLKTLTLALAVSSMLVAGSSGAGAVREQRVRIAVTGQGFQPATVTVQAGQPVVLLVTRKTDRTCATALVLKAYGIDAPLPLGKTVAIRFTPARRGELTYACPMDMIRGKIIVR
jgi:plastocyanin domain-containing protein